jgi:hypothetical protein
MAKPQYHSGSKPLKIFLGLTILLFLFGIGIAVFDVQNQTSTTSQARRSKMIKSEAQDNPITFTNPRASLVQSARPCKVYVGSDIRNISSKKVTFTYNVELRTTTGDLILTAQRNATVGANKTRNIGATLSSTRIKPNAQYNPRVILLNIPDTIERPNYRTMQTIRMPGSC